MKKSFAVIGATLAFAVGAAAQDTPRMEAFLGYTYVRFDSGTNVPAFNANGGSGQFAYNFNRYVSAVADLGAVHKPNIDGFHLEGTFANFLFGPRISMRSSRVRPYGQVLFGGVNAATSRRITVIPVSTDFVTGETIVADPNQAVTTRVSANQTRFAMTAGGGLDIRISKHVSFRPIGLDYYMTRLQNLRTLDDTNQNNLRYTAGFNFTFGAQ